MALPQGVTKLICWLVSLYMCACFGGVHCEVEESEEAISFLQLSKSVHSSLDVSPDTSKQRSKVVFGLFTSPGAMFKERMAAIEETWGKEMSPESLIVIDGNSSIPSIISKESPLCPEEGRYPGIICKQASLIATGFEMGVDWLVVLNDDHYAFPRHWEAMLANYSASDPMIVGMFLCGGSEFCQDGKSGLCGGWGYAVSSGALQAMVGKFVEAPSQNYILENLLAAIENKSPWGDVIISCVARRSGIKEVQIPNDFLGISEKTHNSTRWMNMIKSTQRRPLAFHYIEPDEMRKIHKMVQVAEEARLIGLMEPKDGRRDNPPLELISSSRGR